MFLYLFPQLYATNSSLLFSQVDTTFQKQFAPLNSNMSENLKAYRISLNERQQQVCRLLPTISVTRVVEILKISFLIFSNKNRVNCILLHKFSFFYAILGLFPQFSHIFTKKIQQFQKYSGHTTYNVGIQGSQAGHIIVVLILKPLERSNANNLFARCAHRNFA